MGKEDKNVGSLKEKTISGLLYRFAERSSAQLISTIVSIVLARILMPEDYAIIALVTVLINLGNVFVTDGLGNALIQNKNSDEKDFSTCFWTGFGISLLMYTIVYFSSPMVASFFEKPLLAPIMRVMGLHLIVASLASVQQAYISKNLAFRKLFYVSLGGIILSAVVGLFLANNGAGAWALVAQYLTNSVISTCLLWFAIDWKPKFFFSMQRLKKIFDYAWKLFISSFLNSFYNELRTLIIGKEYTSNDLAFYNRGYSFPALLIGNINTSIMSVLFPVLSLSNDKPLEMKRIVRRALKTSSYILFPMLIGFAAVAETFVHIVLTDKWLGCVVYIQIFCLADMTSPLNSIGANVMRATGRSDLVLNTNIIKKIFGLLIIVATVQLGPVWIAIGILVANVIALAINVLPLKRLIDYSLKEQLADSLPYMLLALVMGVVVWAINLLNWNAFLTLCIQVSVGAIFYILISKFLRIEQYAYVKQIIAQKLGK